MLNSGLLGAIDALPGILFPGGASVVPSPPSVETNIYVVPEQSIVSVVVSDEVVFDVTYDETDFYVVSDEYVYVVESDIRSFAAYRQLRTFDCQGLIGDSEMPDSIGTYNLRKSPYDAPAGVKLTFDYSNTDEIVEGGLVIASAVCKLIYQGLISTDLTVGTAIVDSTGTKVTVPITDVSSVIGNVYYVTCQPTMNDGSKPLLRSLKITIDDVEDSSIQG